ncbi:MAG TPA: four-carbon acid sugar kinase family protein [Humisphaera sp.]|nr:four-carbon acid sugar kinase family protein [Humisphaera sp.]
MIAVIADDFTGAAELAAAAADVGLSAEVQTRFDPSSDAKVIAVDTDTRAMDESLAAKIVSDLSRDILRHDPDWIYKKTDSVLRGNVRAEIEALLAVTDKRRCLLVPANPSKGRTICGGVYCIDGKCLEQTTFANDPLHPRRSSKIAELLGHSIVQMGLAEPAPGEGIMVPDVESEADLMLRASECNSSTLAAGGVEFFIALLRCKAMKQIAISPQPRLALKAQRSLFICGSAQAWSHGRAEECRQRDVPVHAMPEEILSASSDASDRSVHQWADAIARSLKTHGAAMAAIGHECVPSLAATHRLTESLVAVVIDVLNGDRCDHLYVEGGSTAAALTQGIGWTRLQAIPAQLAGVACLRPVGRESPLLFVKPGSYPWPQGVWPSTPATTQSAG